MRRTSHPFRAAALLLALLALLLSGCALEVSQSESTPAFYGELSLVPDTPEQEADPETPEPETAAEQTPTEAPDAGVTEDGSYTAPEDVAAYLRAFGHLPGNFITKRQAQDLGWDSSAGNLWDVAPGKSIGGDRFGNYEGLLPKGGNYRECDVNYSGGYRGGERLVFDDRGGIWYTGDHYRSFTKLDGKEARP